MPVRITDPIERRERLRSLKPGESVVVSKSPPLLWAYPRDIVVVEDGDWLTVRRLSEEEVAQTEYLESL